MHVDQPASPVSIPNQPAERCGLALREPATDMGAWVSLLRDAEIPVKAETAEALEVMRNCEDSVDANLIGEMIGGDPLMTLKLLVFAAKNRSARAVTQPETVTSSLVMLGISPFFRSFQPQPTLEEFLKGRGEALKGINKVLRRASRAANFALAFAVHRLDPDAAVIHQAALLHDFAELLLWCHAPDLALKIEAAQRLDSTLRSKTAQLNFLNTDLTELQQALMEDWKLPEFLIQISGDSLAQHASGQCVSLGVRIARHTALGWDNAAIPDDISDVSKLLNLSSSATTSLLRSLDA